MLRLGSYGIHLRAGARSSRAARRSHAASSRAAGGQAPACPGCPPTYVAAVAYGFFGYICVPARINGRSMEPTYRSGGFMFCWRPRYWIHPPRRGNVVMVHLAGRKVMFLKRVVALEGDTLAFRDGQLILNGEAVAEPYVTGPCNWNVSPRRVLWGRVYVIGDHLSMNRAEHQAGSVSIHRIEGGSLW